MNVHSGRKRHDRPEHHVQPDKAPCVAHRDRKNIKHHKCEVCGKEFSRSSILTVHMVVHSEEKPYQCPVVTCRKSFAILSNARRHLKTHDIDLKAHGRGGKGGKSVDRAEDERDGDDYPSPNERDFAQELDDEVQEAIRLAAHGSASIQPVEAQSVALQKRGMSSRKGPHLTPHVPLDRRLRPTMNREYVNPYVDEDPLHTVAASPMTIPLKRNRSAGRISTTQTQPRALTLSSDGIAGRFAVIEPGSASHSPVTCRDEGNGQVEWDMEIKRGGKLKRVADELSGVLFNGFQSNPKDIIDIQWDSFLPPAWPSPGPSAPDFTLSPSFIGATQPNLLANQLPWDGLTGQSLTPWDVHLDGTSDLPTSPLIAQQQPFHPGVTITGSSVKGTPSGQVAAAERSELRLDSVPISLLDGTAGDIGRSSGVNADLSIDHPNHGNTSISFVQEYSHSPAPQYGVEQLLASSRLSAPGCSTHLPDTIGVHLDSDPVALHDHLHYELTSTLGFPPFQPSNVSFQRRSTRPLRRSGPDSDLLRIAFTLGSLYPDIWRRNCLDRVLQSGYFRSDKEEPSYNSLEGAAIMGMPAPLSNVPSGQSVFVIFTDKKRCLMCGKATTSSTRAIGCVRGHLDQRPFVCPGEGGGCKTCGKKEEPARFYTAALLDDHITGQIRKYTCPKCGIQLRRGGLSRHLKAKHPESGPM